MPGDVCVMMIDQDKCAGLKKKNCTGCTFHKTLSQAQSSLRESQKRLLKLSDKEQDAIAETYYGGRHPWKGKGGQDGQNEG